MEFQDLIYQKEGHVATITLNRPERLNAFTGTMIDGLIQSIRDANDVFFNLS